MTTKFKSVALVLSLALLVLLGILIHTFSQNNTQVEQLEKSYQDSLLYYRTLSAANASLFEKEYAQALAGYLHADSLAVGEHRWQELATLHIDLINKGADSLHNLKNTTAHLNKMLSQMGDRTATMQGVLDSMFYRVEKDSLQLNAFTVYNHLLSADIQDLKAELNHLSNAYGKLAFHTPEGKAVNYFGEISNGRAWGYGMGILDTRGIYEGHWKNNARHGSGSYTWANGDRYEGSFVEGKREGHGIYYFASGEKYVGEWRNDVREGKGVFYDKDGSVLLEGNWQNDKYLRNKATAAAD
jgi:hypothetical protein